MSGARARVVALLLGVALLALLPAPRASAAPSASDVRTAAERWCAQALARAWARPGVDAFVAGRVDSSRGYWFVHVGQRWRGLVVEPVDVCVTLDARGTVLRSNGTLIPRPEPAGAWTLGATEAEARGRQAAAVRSAPVGAAERVLALSGGALRPAYRVRSAPKPGLEPNELIVDAERGDVLIARGGAWHAVGNVYPTDGRDTLATVTLTGLDAGDSVLSGPLVRAEDGTLRQLVGPNGDFRLTPSVPDTTRFDEVNVWWYVQQYLSWLGSRGYRGFVDTLHVRTHAAIAPNVAYTSGNYVLLADSVTNFAHDAARARDVVTHELQHFVSEGYGLVHGSREGDALQEGLSDYMAAACTGDPRIGEWEYRLYPNGVTTVASDPAVFNYANLGAVSWGGVEAGSTWADGMIFSGALWDLRTQLGATADSLVLETLPRVPSSPTFGQFAEAMVDADASGHEGLHETAIERTFGRRGVVGGGVLTIAGPDSLYWEQPGQFTLAGSAVVDAAHAQWTVTRHLANGRVDSLVNVGTGWALTYSDSVDFVLTARAANGWASTSVAQVRVAQRPIVLALTGKWIVSPGQDDAFTLAPSAYLATTPPQWSVGRYCGLVPCGPPAPVGSGWSLVHADTSDYDLVVTLSGAWGQPLSRTAFVSVQQPVVAIDGPRYFDGIAPLSYVANVKGVPPFWYRWTYYYLPRSSNALVVLSSGESAIVNTATTFDLGLKVTDARGRTSELQQRVYRPQLRMRGPAWAASDSICTFIASTDTVYNDLVMSWDACALVGAAWGPWQPAGTGKTLPFAPHRDTQVRVTLGGADSLAITKSVLVQVRAPQVRVAEAGVLGGARRYRADVKGAGPFDVRWTLIRARGSDSVSVAGTGDTLVVTADSSYRLVADVVDVNGRSGTDTLTVTIDHPPPVVSRSVGLAAPAIAGRELVLTAWAPATPAAKLVIFDLTGREVERWFDGSYEGGTRTWTRSTGDLAQGVYFVRWSAAGLASTRRVVIVR